MRGVTSILIVVAFSACSVSAEDLADLAAERPGFSIPSAPVGLGILQVEQGYTYEGARLGPSKLTTLSAVQSTVRFGVTGAVELRFSTVGFTSQWVQERGQTAKAAGASDCLLGMKVRLLRQTAAGPEVSIIGDLSLPVRTSPFTSSGHDPSFTVAADKDLPGKFSMIANANFASITGPLGRVYSSGEGFWVTRVMKPISPFMEMFRTTIGPGLGSEVVLEGGFFRNLGKHAQIDIEAGHTVAGDRPSLSASMGLVIRLPQALLGPERLRFHQH